MQKPYLQDVIRCELVMTEKDKKYLKICIHVIDFNDHIDTSQNKNGNEG